MDVKPTSRRQRRAWRLQKLAAAREARKIARMAGLDFRVSGESGALVVHTHSLRPPGQLSNTPSHVREDRSCSDSP